VSLLSENNQPRQSQHKEKMCISHVVTKSTEILSPLQKFGQNLDTQPHEH